MESAKTPDQIVDELQQLCDQYRAEVPARRRTWPKSIKERVFQLRQLELSCDAISKLTGIPVATIHSWKLPQPKAFLPIKIIEKAVRTKAIAPVVVHRIPESPPKSRRAKARPSIAPAPTIIVIAPNGLRVEGLDLSSALALAREIDSWT